jgi:cation/acetate symporter
MTVCFYLIAQMVGSGSLIKLMFGLPYELAVIVVGVIMIAYVLFGGMLATTWVQIIKAVLLLGGATVLVLHGPGNFGFNFRSTCSSRRPSTAKVLEPGGLVSNPWDALSLGIALMFGTAGLPHILMRFYTVPDAKAARKSVLYATGLISYFYILTFIIGFGAMVLVGQDVISGLDKGGNMAALLLAEVTGGIMFLGFIAAVAFATILAVVGGPDPGRSHDLLPRPLRQRVPQGAVPRGKRGQDGQARHRRPGRLAIALGIAFKGQNVAFMVGLAFAIAASANFPALLLSILWRNFSTVGATLSIATGTTLAVGLIVVSPTVWVDVLKNPMAIFPLKNPAIISMTAAFLAGYVGSKLWPDKLASEKYEEQKIRNYLGVGAESEAPPRRRGCDAG